MAYFKSRPGGASKGTNDQIPKGVIPHIIPDVLYPAVAGKLLDGSTSHSGAYGTAQADGFKYYYTDIKGSKPIKDPRIGAHFGSQRHKFRSLQLLEQETATHGSSIYSIDGREWCRVVANTAGSTGFTMQNDSYGEYMQFGSTADTNEDYIEFTGYFNALNIIEFCSSARKAMHFSLNGTSNIANFTDNSTTVLTPLGNRFVDSNSVLNVPLTSISLGINTVRWEMHGGNQYNRHSGIELITQDTTSTATKSKIQIPAQTVVSYGKKLSVSAAAHHYDPFNGFTNSTTLHSAVVDTATSLGLSSAPGSSASWAISGSNNIRPYNGGRVVKWVASDGTIKTSVNMMPPNAQALNTTAAAEITTPSATNTAYLPAFSDDAVDSSLAEVAKSFHWREFGNGSANGTANYADVSRLTTTADDIAYVIDDGLTSFWADDARVWPDVAGDITLGGDKYAYFTFIGTGLTLNEAPPNTSANAIDNGTYAQNLPYGTHIFQYFRTDASADIIKIDGVTVHSDSSTNGYIGNKYWNIHQPKMPPIPEDAVVIADYMLMADFVAQSAAADPDKISKGVRWVAQSRDFKFDKTAGDFVSVPFISANPGYRSGQYFWWSPADGNSVFTQELTFFGDSFSCYFATGGDSDYDPPVFTLDGSALSGFTNTGAGPGFSSVTSAGVVTETGNPGADSVVNFVAGAGTLGSNTIKCSITGDSGSDYAYNRSFAVHTPIHTSSHYQTFETPLLHELVGGDRNMEQTNLVVTGDGKTWDEVTRDTSYIGNVVLQANHHTQNTGATAMAFGEWRGLKQASATYAHVNLMNKDFAIANDRQICLKDGSYSIHAFSITSSSGSNGTIGSIWVNGAVHSHGYNGSGSSSYPQSYLTAQVNLQRGDYVQMYGQWRGSAESGYWIERI